MTTQVKRRHGPPGSYPSEPPVSHCGRYGIRPNVLIDGDMSAAGTGAYTPISSATLTKEVGRLGAGSQCLRVARNGINNPGASQSILTVGRTYFTDGWFRGDGTKSPLIKCLSLVIATGAVSTEWQYFSNIFVADGTNLRLLVLTSTDNYAEFGPIRVIRIGG